MKPVGSVIRAFLACVLLMGTGSLAHAQFQKEAFSQNYGADNSEKKDTVEQMFSIKEYVGGLRHKNELKIGTMAAGSAVFIGGCQIYNEEYWKLPFIYGGIGALGGTGLHFMNKYSDSKKALADFELARDEFLAANPSAEYPNAAPMLDTGSQKTGKLLLAGAGLVYWATLMDGVTRYQRDVHPHPGRATLYSILLPGLGQIYNGEYWKLPIYYGCLVGAGHFYYTNNLNYQRFKRIHNEATNTSVAYSGPISAENAKMYRDVYRRYRDYSIVFLAGFYILQVMDANIFAYMHDFEVSDNIALKMQPSVLNFGNSYAFNTSGSPALGMSFGLRF